MPRAFTDPARTREDLAALESMRRSLAERLSSEPRGGRWTARGESHWLVAPDPDALARTRPLIGVGFFGQARELVDHAPIFHLECSLLERASDFPGLLAYHNVHFEDGRWGNLVLFADLDGLSHVREDPEHVEALGIAPSHYSSVRLHRVRFEGGAHADEPPVLDSTLLIDFGETPAWRAVRRYER
jgi:hypothetical protein